MHNENRQTDSSSEIKQGLAFDILHMMAGNFDRWDQETGTSSDDSLVKCAQVAAQGIAARMTQALAQNTGEMNSGRWQKIVEDATRDAVMEVTDGGPMVRLGKSRGFAEAVVECTAPRVAPIGSEWAIQLEAREERRLRDSVKKYGLPPHEIDRLVKEWRAHRLEERVL